MKKQYESPRVYAESFELIDHIAGNCHGVETDKQYTVTHRSVDNCAFQGPDQKESGIFLFVDASNNCTYLEDADYMNAPFECYNSATTNYAYFAS